MSQSLMLTQALLALLGLFAGAWVLLNPSFPKNSPHSILAGAINFAAAAYLLCDIGRAQADEISQLVAFEKANTGLAIALLALLPWTLLLSQGRKPTLFLLVYSANAAALEITNLLSPISLRYQRLQQSLTNPSLVQASDSPWSIALGILAVTCSAFCIHRAIKLHQENSPKLVILLTSTAIATFSIPLAALTRDATTHPSDNFNWIAVALIAICSSTLSPRAKKRKESPTPPKPNPSNPNNLDDDEKEETPLKQHALLLQLKESDAVLASKLLSSQGFTVMREDEAAEIPSTYFEDKGVHYSIFFDRDSNNRPPANLKKLIQGPNSHVSLFALTHKPRTPRILREIRNKDYTTAIESPLKATELFRILESHNDTTFHWTQTPHTHLS